MFRLARSSIRARKARFFLSAVAVALGVAFMAGTLVLTATMGRAYDGIAARAAQGTDALVRSNRAVTDPDLGTEVRGTVDDETVAAVRAVSTVSAAEPVVQGIAQLVGADGQLVTDNSNGAAPLGLAWQHDADLRPLDLVAGREPTAADDIVVDRASARAGHIEPGDLVRVVTETGSAPYRVAGLATYGGADDAGGVPVIAFTPDTAARVLGTPGRYDGVAVKAVPGVSETELVTDVAAALQRADDVEVVTGSTLIAEAKTKSREGMAFMATFLVAFAVAALLVGSFVIANSFSITVAQRTRENALNRALGASRRQVLGGVLVESAATGLVASAMGVVLGIGIAVGLRELLAGFGLDLPSGPLVISSSTVTVCVIVGTIVTVAAAFVPARKASRVPPVAALRDVSVDRTGRSLRRAFIGGLITAAGGALLAAGLAGVGTGALGLGAVLVFAGVAVLGPTIPRPVARLLGAPLVARGVPGRLARENASRNPRRTAAAASALTVGVGLVVLITVLAASAKTSIAASVDEAARADWIVATVPGQGGLSPHATAAIDALPETAAVTPFRYTAASIDGSGAVVSAFDPTVIDRLIDLDLQAGDIAGVAAGGLAVQAAEAEANGWSVGDRVTVDFPETGTVQLTVAALYGTRDPMGPYAVSLSTYAANVANGSDRYVIVASTPGVAADQVRTAIESVLAAHPTAKLQTNAEFTASLAAEIDELLALVYALLLLTVVIALFGIANTLALSIHERTREIGVLRAVGLTRGQLRSAVRWESVIVALLGTALGLAIGLAFGWALVRALSDQGLDHLTMPPGQLLAIVVVGAVAGVAAAVSPARRASRIDTLTALRAD